MKIPWVALILASLQGSVICGKARRLHEVENLNEINLGKTELQANNIFDAERGDVCFDIVLTTTRWGSENSWVLGTCASTMVHENHNTHEAVECCLPPGEYTLECKDSYGDGWHGGYITVNGAKYCEDFDSSSLETHEILIGSDTEPEESTSWTEGLKCTRGDISDGTLFLRDFGLTLEEAKTKCALGCDSRDDCVFAVLYFDDMASCYLKGSECGDWVTASTHLDYHLYRKGCQQTTVTIKTRTKIWGSENSWTIGSCTNEAQFENHQTVFQTCCLAAGSYNLECKDGNGDGWHGGYLEINGKKFCNEFTWGGSKTEVVTI